MVVNPRAKLTCSVTGLKPKRFYNYRVIAFNAVGQGKSAKMRKAIDLSIKIVSFAVGKTTMWSGLARQASITASYIKRFKYTKVTVTGFTNPGGSLAGRTRFTQARALTVANFLTRRLRALGITGVSIVASGNGASIYNHPNQLQRKKNRSVSTLLSY
jgi:outer membrane protein OmpA-like peptidoglycan-associated protein